jgi:hypothetical protein
LSLRGTSMKMISPTGTRCFGSGFGLPSPSCFWLGGSRFGSFGYHFVAGCDLVAFAPRSVQSCLWFLTSRTRTVLFCLLFFKTSSLIIYLVLVLPTFLLPFLFCRSSFPLQIRLFLAQNEPGTTCLGSGFALGGPFGFAFCFPFCPLIVLYVTFLATIC